MHSRIFLIGFMGSGKTTYGKKIARMMSYNFVDMDELISQTEGMSISDIFTTQGEEYFREKEKEAISKVAKMNKVVVATGGGVPCFGNNLELLKEAGLTIYLKLEPKALVSRLKNAKSKRPLLAGKSPEEMLQTVEEMLKVREVFYKRADMIIDGHEGVSERVVNAIQRRSE